MPLSPKSPRIGMGCLTLFYVFPRQKGAWVRHYEISPISDPGGLFQKQKGYICQPWTYSWFFCTVEVFCKNIEVLPTTFKLLLKTKSTTDRPTLFTYIKKPLKLSVCFVFLFILESSIVK